MSHAAALGLFLMAAVLMWGMLIGSVRLDRRHSAKPVSQVTICMHDPVPVDLLSGETVGAICQRCYEPVPLSVWREREWQRLEGEVRQRRQKRIAEQQARQIAENAELFKTILCQHNTIQGIGERVNGNLQIVGHLCLDCRTRLPLDPADWDTHRRARGEA